MLLTYTNALRALKSIYFARKFLNVHEYDVKFKQNVLHTDMSTEQKVMDVSFFTRGTNVGCVHIVQRDRYGAFENQEQYKTLEEFAAAYNMTFILKRLGGTIAGVIGNYSQEWEDLQEEVDVLDMSNVSK